MRKKRTRRVRKGPPFALSEAKRLGLVAEVTRDRRRVTYRDAAKKYNVSLSTVVRYVRAAER